MSRKKTDIEIIFHNLLKELNISCKREYYHDYYPVDFFLPNYNLSIQVDGSFHHGPCKSCKTYGKKLLPRQIFQSRRDASCIMYHKYRGINILRICECKIKQDLINVKILLLTVLEKIKNGEKIYYDRDKYRV